ncbi:MAG: hypothetical protein R3C24_07500 [Cyanobacteriota/Melainabacteria group bacterium]
MAPAPAGYRGTNVVTEDERNANSRAAGGRGTNVITEDDREHSQDRKINELTTRWKPWSVESKELERAVTAPTTSGSQITEHRTQI